MKGCLYMGWDKREKSEAYNLINTINEIYMSNIFEEKNEKLFFWDDGNLKSHIKERKNRAHLTEEQTKEDYLNIVERVLTDNPEIGLHPKKDRYLFGKAIASGEYWVVSLTPERKVITTFKADTFDDYANYFPASHTSEGFYSLGTYEELKQEFEMEQD